jgi:hydroxymethylpyrimidine pyrophosphatase-like HAD family hydrolase
MPYFFRAVALDLDGTIAEDGVVNLHVVKAVAELRRRGRSVILCTGRILGELRQLLPDAERYFDVIVAENGAVLAMPGRGVRLLAAPVGPDLARAAKRRGIPVRAGSVLLATKAAYGADLLQEIERLELDAQLIRNRDELMVLPAGVTKATGLMEALAELEVSRHSTIAFGDAENDIALLQACEVGVAVGNAVDSLRARADVVLEKANGDGVAEYLLGPVLNGECAVQPARWQLRLGMGEDGSAVTLPGSRINVLIAGASCAGKSYVAGLLIEQLAALGYSACVFDCEGDHAGLASLRGIISVGGPDPLPGPPQLARLIRNRFSTVIVDLSLLPHDSRRAYFHAARRELLALRQASGLPHWIVVEEADQLLHDETLPGERAHAPPAGYCLVTHRPGALAGGILHAVDAVIAVSGAECYATGAEACDAMLPADRPLSLPVGEALLAIGGTATRFTPGPRSTPHVRHRHKYVHAQVPPQRRFYFGGGNGSVVAGNLAEFCRCVQEVGEDVLRHHLQAGDFSRWVHDVLADDDLGARLRSLERWYRSEPGLAAAHVRAAIISEIQSRYAVAGGSG